MRYFIDQIAEALGLASPGKTPVRLEPFDMGRDLGVMVTLPTGHRHAIRVPFRPGWESEAITLLNDYLKREPAA